MHSVVQNIMKFKSILAITAWMLLASCISIPVHDSRSVPPQPTLSIRPAPSATSTPDAASRLDAVPSATLFETLAPALQTTFPVTCLSQACILNGHFLFNAPLPATANLIPDATYRYGFTQSKKRPLHHGIDIKNFLGTPVLAAGEGMVIVAGNDKDTIYGEKENFYGNLIIIQHDIAQIGQPVFTLYGHLSRVEVKVGQRVKTGEEIGKVGMTGVAIGYHLHFEVRVGENKYENTRNPELWLKPQADSAGVAGGALAGRIMNSKGKPMRIAKIVLKREQALPQETQIYLNTYDDPAIPRRIGGARDDSFLMPYQDDEITLGRDDDWREDFALSNLTPGKYLFTFTSQIVYRQVLEIKAGQVTLINVKTDY